MPKQKKDKQVHLTSEQIKAQELAKVEMLRKRKIVIDHLFPLLFETTTSVEDARIFCGSVSMAVKQAFQNKLKEVRLSELKMHAMLSAKGDAVINARYARLFDFLNDETLLTVIELLEGMEQEIGDTLRKESMTRQFKDLKLPTWEAEQPKSTPPTIPADVQPAPPAINTNDIKSDGKV